MNVVRGYNYNLLKINNGIIKKKYLKLKYTRSICNRINSQVYLIVQK